MPNGGGTTPPTSGVDGMSTLAAFDGASFSAFNSNLSEKAVYLNVLPYARISVLL